MVFKTAFQILLFISVLGLKPLLAQQAISAAGGNASSPTGSVSFTAGQVFYHTLQGGPGTVAQGVQQPYEIWVVTGLDETGLLSLICTVYPNPAADYLKLNIEGPQELDLDYALYDLNGRLLVSGKALLPETILSMREYKAGFYFLKIVGNKEEFKVFKIIKN